jgi:transposase
MVGGFARNQQLMTVSGVGPIVSLLFKATIDDPSRFEDSKAVAAHLGLTPRVYQSGEIDRSGHISKCGDKLMRHALSANSGLGIVLPCRCNMAGDYCALCTVFPKVI